MWSPGETLVIDCGEQSFQSSTGEQRVHVFCAVLAWSRFRFVRFAVDQRQDKTDLLIPLTVGNRTVTSSDVRIL